MTSRNDFLRSIDIFDDACLLCGQPSLVSCANCKGFTNPAMRPICYPPLSGFFTLGQFISADRTVHDPFRVAIRRFKEAGNYLTGIALGQLLAEALEPLAHEWCTHLDYVIPVPPEPGRALDRGFSPTLALASCLSARLAIPLLPSALSRTPSFARSISNTPRQTEKLILSDYLPGHLQGKNILLVDDVVTTGTTLSHCANVLLNLGAERVFACTLAVSGYRRTPKSATSVPDCLLLSGPPGVGKTTLIRALEASGKFAHPVHYTTRARRRGEADGIDFNFTTHDHFRDMVLENKMMAWTSYIGNYYGYTKQSIVNSVKSGKIPVLNLEPQLALHVKQHLPASASVFLNPPDLETLLERLRKRQPEMPLEWLQERRVKAKEAMDYSVFFDIVLHAQNPEKTLDDLLSYLTIDLDGSTI